MRRAVVLLLASFSFLSLHISVALAQATGATPATAARGESIVRNIAVCGSCHAAEAQPPNPDGPLSGGREFRDWRIGVARASNLTPDNETGLGTWSEADIVRALRTGQRKDGRLLAPVMPYEWFHDMSDDDAFAVARYLKSLPPVRNAVRQSPNLAFKFGKLLFLKAKTGPPAPETDRGAYLTQHVGLCAECHTPRGGLLNRPDRSRLMQGWPNAPKDFPVKPTDLRVVAQWSEDDFLRTIRTGVDPSGHKLNPFMPWPQNARMTDDDLRAMYRFIRSLSSLPQTGRAATP